MNPPVMLSSAHFEADDQVNIGDNNLANANNNAQQDEEYDEAGSYYVSVYSNQTAIDN